MTILYPVRNGLYVNMTNRCPCACTFCLRQQAPGVYGSHSLWLEREPTREEIKNEFAKFSLHDYDEIVFCGYGEPTERLDDLLAIAAWLKAREPRVKIRVNTNGLTDLIHQRSTANDFANLIDCVSISLNTDDPEEYREICKPSFGADAYPALLAFAKNLAKVVPRVILTVVGEPITSREKQNRCREICTRLGAELRVRPYEG